MEYYSYYAPPPIVFNITVGLLCPFECFLSCPPGCTPFSWPPLPPPLVEDPSKQSISATVIILLIVFLGGFFVLVSYFAVIAKICSSCWKSSRRSQDDLGHTHDDFIGENHGTVGDHHIWFIHTVGLDESVIKSIAVCKYKKGDGLVEGTDCSVCLGEFKEDETLRLLPKCSHAFHVPCIDTWLGSHTNCPLCRAPIVCNNSTVGDSSSDSLGLREDAQVGSFVSEFDRSGEVGDRDVRDEKELQDGRRDIDIIEKMGMPFPLSKYDVRALSDLVDKHRVVDNGMEPVRRSVSMDSTSAYKLCFSSVSPSEIEEENEPAKLILDRESSSSVFRWLGSSSSGKMLLKGPISMNRSLSNGGRFLSSKLSRSGRNQILPL
ncbi:hypothetical protein GIB67_005701 [Kingdonia uniflora]|uniref:RING-type E3 ubiquitin transferase n=1 Tax=Kingdonia uniflora TaxID=39325 RepID=A0A7J7NI09_9MAGN|nr:hypothetical protein GIB67_005701 [Kingdonia uniflora]